MTAPGRTWTLPAHKSCVRHADYQLNCRQFERLIERAQGCCEICGVRFTSDWPAKPCIDHDHDLPIWAVRGLLCGACNTRLKSCIIFRPEAVAYLENAWWSQECIRQGLPVGLGVEPPVPSAIRNQWGVVFVRDGGGGWYAPKQGCRGPISRDWGSLYESYGPQNMVSYDLRSAMADGSIQRSVRFNIENCAGWTSVRSALGLPEPAQRRDGEWQGPDAPPWLKTPATTADALRRLLTPGQCLRVAQILSQGADSPGAA